MSFKEKVEGNAGLIIASVAIAAFGTGWQWHKTQMEDSPWSRVKEGTYILKTDLESEGYVATTRLAELGYVQKNNLDQRLSESTALTSQLAVAESQCAAKIDALQREVSAVKSSHDRCFQSFVKQCPQVLVCEI